MRHLPGLLTLACASAFATSAFADEFARVISSTPIVQQVSVSDPACTSNGAGARSSGGGAALGTLIGAIVGHGISTGAGSGRAVATGIGAVAGAVIGDSVERSQRSGSSCSAQTRYEHRTVGYQVTYEYAGRQYTTQMAQDPGPTVRLQIQPIGAVTQGAAPLSAYPAPSPQLTPPEAYGAPYLPSMNAGPVVAPTQVVVGTTYVHPVAVPVWPAPAVVSAPGVVGGHAHRHWRHHRHQHAHSDAVVIGHVLRPVPARPHRHWD